MHLHRERENAAFFHPLRTNVQFALIELDQGFGDHEAESNPLAIHLSCTEQLPKLLAERWNLTGLDPFATVGHLDGELVLGAIVACNDHYYARAGELDRIFEQIYQYLLESLFVAFHEIGQANLFESVYVVDQA